MENPDRPTTPCSRRRAAWVLATLALASCGGGDDGGGGGDAKAKTQTSTAAQALPPACAKPPLTMRLEARGETPAGGPEFKVTDAAARRVPIVLGEKQGTDPASVARQTMKAKVSQVAFYTLYLSDSRIDRKELTGNGFGNLKPPPGGTIGALSIVPGRDVGLKVGDVVTYAAKPDYETVTTFSAITLSIDSDQHHGPDALNDITGQVTVLALTDDVICLDINIEVVNAGAPVLAAKGVVAAQVYRSGESWFLR
ncbi:MAG: hypothetical protein ACRDZW_01445 [Acidimicrobiales bacterium]